MLALSIIVVWSARLCSAGGTERTPLASAACIYGQRSPSLWNPISTLRSVLAYEKNMLRVSPKGQDRTLEFLWHFVRWTRIFQCHISESARLYTFDNSVECGSLIGLTEENETPTKLKPCPKRHASKDLNANEISLMEGSYTGSLPFRNRKGDTLDAGAWGGAEIVGREGCCHGFWQE